MTVQIPTPRCQLEKMSRVSTYLVNIRFSLLSASEDWKRSGECAPKLFLSLALSVSPCLIAHDALLPPSQRPPGPPYYDACTQHQPGRPLEGMLPRSTAQR